MFSVIIPGRPCITNIVAVDGQINPTKFAFTFPLSPPFSEVIVFFLPGIVLPQDTAAAVYIQLPQTDSGAPPAEFKLLGALTNEEPSASFPVQTPHQHRTEAQDEDEMLDIGGGANAGVAGRSAPANAIVTLGISVEPFQTIAPQVAQLKAASKTGPHNKPSTDLVVQSQQRKQKEISTKVLAQRIIGNAFNYLASFATSDNDPVPLKHFREWWNKFERKLDMDPGFLEREEINV